MAALESGYVEIEIEIEFTGGGETEGFSIGIAGDFQTPDRSQVAMDLDSGDAAGFELEIIAIGDLTYLKYPGGDGWTRSPDPFTPYTDLFEFGAFNTDLDTRAVEGFNPVIEEELVGERVYYLKGSVSREEMADLLDDPEETFSEGEVEYWVGAEDFLVRKMAVRGISPEDGFGSSTMEAEMRLSDYGKPVNIQAPDAEPFDALADHRAGVTTEALESGWVRMDSAEMGFAVSFPPSWELDDTSIALDVPLAARDTAGPDPHGIRSQFTLKIDQLFSLHEGLDEYLEAFKANLAFYADIEEQEIEVRNVNLPMAGDAALFTFSNDSPRLGIRLSHLKYILVHYEVALEVTFTAPAEIFEEMSPVFMQIAETIETY